MLKRLAEAALGAPRRRAGSGSGNDNNDGAAAPPGEQEEQKGSSPAGRTGPAVVPPPLQSPVYGSASSSVRCFVHGMYLWTCDDWLYMYADRSIGPPSLPFIGSTQQRQRGPPSRSQGGHQQQQPGSSSNGGHPHHHGFTHQLAELITPKLEHLEEYYEMGEAMVEEMATIEIPPPVGMCMYGRLFVRLYIVCDLAYVGFGVRMTGLGTGWVGSIWYFLKYI